MLPERRKPRRARGRSTASTRLPRAVSSPQTMPTSCSMPSTRHSRQAHPPLPRHLPTFAPRLPTSPACRRQERHRSAALPPSMRYGAPLPSAVRCAFCTKTDAASNASGPFASTACSSARVRHTSAASTMPPTISEHSAATASFAPGGLRKATPFLRISTSTITYSLSSILPTAHPLRLRSRSRVKRRPI